MKELELMKTHSLKMYDELREEMERDSLLRWLLLTVGAVLGVWLLIIVSGCGGGSMARTASVPSPPPVVVTPPPPPQATLPATYALAILLPLPGGSAAQAEAINAAGQVVGYSIVDGAAEATMWQGGSPIYMGQGWALAISSATMPQVAGYSVDSGPPIAELWPDGAGSGMALGTLAGFDSSEALGVDDDGTVVGLAFEQANPAVQQAFSWNSNGRMVAISNMAEALAIHHGRVAGFDQSGQAVVDGNGLGIQGAATSISDAGAGGFTFGSVTQGFAWQAGAVTLLGTSGTAVSLAAGINGQGVIVGQVGANASGSVRLAPVGARAKLAPRFQGSTRAMAWTPTDGMVDLNGRIDPSDADTWALVFADGINDAGSIVGAAVSNGTQQTVGFALEGR